MDAQSQLEVPHMHIEVANDYDREPHNHTQSQVKAVESHFDAQPEHKIVQAYIAELLEKIASFQVSTEEHLAEIYTETVCQGADIDTDSAIHGDSPRSERVPLIGCT